eukprot:scaffold42226_cov45-Attheya_sp.AAC.4
MGFEAGHVFQVDGDEALPNSLINSFDAIFVLGGGVPSAPDKPPFYVEKRCDAAAQVYQQSQKSPAILCLSAGTAHMPQLLSVDGLPVWESTSSATYLLDKLNIPPKDVFVETTSYDTISNAYFARTSFTDVTGWKRLLIITNEFHMERTKAIFDWIFGVSRMGSAEFGYELYYLSCDNEGLSSEAIAARAEHEAKGAKNVRDKLAKEYNSLRGVLQFLTEKHDFYSATKLSQRAIQTQLQSDLDPKSAALKRSYGGGGGDHDKMEKSSHTPHPIWLLVTVTVAAVVLRKWPGSRKSD